MITENEILTDIISLVKEYVPSLDQGELNMDSRINSDASIDSMGFVLIISKLEVKYNIRIPDRQFSHFVTIGDVVRYIEKRLA